MIHRVFRIAGILVIFCAAIHAQRTIHVPADEPTIQAGIDAANNGDTVLVAPGTYTERIYLKGKAITLTTGATSYSDPLTTSTLIQTTDDDYPTVNLIGTETHSTVINGFTLTGSQTTRIMNKNGTDLATLECGNSGPTITNNYFTSGVYGVECGAAYVAGNHFDGLVIYALAINTGIVTDNLFENNQGSQQPTLYAFGNTLVQQNIFRNNHGDGTAYLNAGVVFINNLLYNNDNPLVLLASAESSVTTVVAENTFSNSVTRDCSVAGYCPTGSQISIQVDSAYSGSNLLIANNIFAASDPGSLIGCVDPIPFDTTLPPNTDTALFDHNLFFNSGGGTAFNDFCRTQITPSGNFSADPQFVDAAANDFHLKATSPAIDAGNNSVLQQIANMGFALTSDYDSNPRPVDATNRGYPVLDIGAFEYPAIADGQPTSVLLLPSAYVQPVNLPLTLSTTVTSPLGVPYGTVSFFANGAAIGTAALDSNGRINFKPTALGLGFNEIEADYPGAGPFTPGVSLKTIVRIEPIPTTLTLTATPNPARPGSAVTITVAVTAADGTIPTPVTLTDNGAPLATLSPDATGHATLIVSTFSLGAHVLVATYAGDTEHAPATATVTLNIVAHDFTLTIDPTSLTIKTEYHAPTTLHLVPLGDFAENVTLSCLNLPAYASCTFGQNNVVLNQSMDIQDMVDTDLILRFRSALSPTGNHPGPTRSLPVFLALLPFVCLGRRRHFTTARRLTLAALLLSSLSILSGCSGKYPAHTAPGTYTVTIQAVSTSGIIHTAPLTLTVTP